VLRQKILTGCEQLIWDFFNSGGQVIIYDANNGTKERRREIGEKAEKQGIHIIFLGISYIYFSTYTYTNNGMAMPIESMCDNEDIILSNIRGVKISSPDVC
jgi:6-phosphofructo-2-kinase / fructose-2,6-biphosphatase 4